MIKINKSIVSVILLTVFLSSIGAVNVQNPSGNPDSLFPKNQPSNADYTVKTNGSTCWAVQPDGNISLQSTDASYVINSCLSQLAATSGGTLYIDKAEYLITSKIVIPQSIQTNSGERAYIEIASNRAVLKIGEKLQENAIELVASAPHYSFKISGLSVFCHSKIPSYYALNIENAMYVFLQDVELGWEGLCIKNTDSIWIDNFYAVDCAGEGLKLDNVGYCWASDFFVDNCGGWGGFAGYNAVLLNASARLYFSDFNVFGEKGLYGGQENGIYMDTVGFSTFSNFQIDGFKKSSIVAEGCQRLTFSNFELIGADEHPFTLTSNTKYPIESVHISDFNIYVNNGKDGLAFYSHNGKGIQYVTVSDGFIFGKGNGITLSDDASACCQDITVSNTVFNVIGYGVHEGGISDFNTFSGVNTRAAPNGIHTVGDSTKVVSSWNYTTWILQS
jgi:hypothetical protein